MTGSPPPPGGASGSSGAGAAGSPGDGGGGQGPGTLAVMAPPWARVWGVGGAAPAAAPAAPAAVRLAHLRWACCLAAGGAAGALTGPWLVLVLAACGLCEVTARSRAGGTPTPRPWALLPGPGLRALAAAPAAAGLGA